MADLNAEIPEDLKTDFDVACAARKLNKKEAVAEAIRKWLGKDDKEGESEDPDLERVRYIFEHGAERRVNDFRGNIDLFYGDAKRNPRRPKRKAG